MLNLKAKLQKTRDSLAAPLKSLFSRGAQLSDDDRDSIEELLLGADVGVDACDRIMSDLYGSNAGDDPRSFLREEFLRLLGTQDEVPVVTARPRAIVVIGVNGVGKTTSIAKLAHHLKNGGKIHWTLLKTGIKSKMINKIG